MALYHILKDFKGSQDGRFAEDFTAGTEADLSDYLVSCLPADSIRRVEQTAEPVVPKKRKVAVSVVPTSAE